MNATNAATKTQLFDEMHVKGSVLNGWDAVLSLSAGHLAKRLQRQWPAAASGARQVTLLSAHPAAPGEAQGAAQRRVGQMQIELGAPQITLLPGQPTLGVDFPVQRVQGRSGALGAARVTRALPTLAHNDVSVTWDTPDAIDVPTRPDAKLSVQLPLRVVRVPSGSASSPPVFEVVLDVAGATAVAHQLPAAAGDGSDLAREALNTLGGADRRLVVATVDGSTQAKYRALQPNAVALRTVRTASGQQLLQMHFALGDTPAPQDTGVDLGDPVPVDDGLAWSLLFSSQKVYQDLVVPGFNKRSKHVQLTAAAPQGEQRAWFLQTKSRMYFQGTVDWGDAMPPVAQQAQLGLNFTGSPRQGLLVSPFADPGATVNLEFGIQQNYPVQCSGQPGQQTVAFAGSDATVTAPGVAEKTFKPYLDLILGKEIRSDLDATSLQPLATFAVHTIRYPGDEAVIDAVQIPGDLVMVGDLQPDKTA
jgi:hypothetical protein